MHRVLLVDDYEVVRKGVRFMLSAASDLIVCGEGANGVEAIKAALETRPDIVLLDVNMPVMDGITAAKKIREILPKTKILLLTIHDERTMRCMVEASDADGYLSKTASADELLKAIRNIVGGDLRSTAVELDNPTHSTLDTGQETAS